MCTEFFLLSKEPNLLSARTFDFPFDPQYKVDTVKSNKGNTYSYLFVYTFNNKDFITDAINSEGLILNTLWLSDTVYYENKNNKNAEELIFFLDIPKIILSECKTVDDVRNKYDKKLVYAEEIYIEGIGTIIGRVHFSIHDKHHNSIILEIYNGVIQIHENKYHVMTNQPFYEWHLRNVDNYASLTNQPLSSNNYAYPPLHGGGLWGLPGDFTSVSRFVKTQKLMSFIKKKFYTDNELLCIADNIIGHSVIPKDVLMEIFGNTMYNSITHYTIIKNQKERAFLIKNALSLEYTTYRL